MGLALVALLVVWLASGLGRRGGLQVGMIESRSVELARTYRDIVIPVCLHGAVLRLRSSKCTDEEQEIRKSRAEHHQPRNWPMAQAIMSSMSPPSGLTAIKSGHVTGDNFPYRSSQSLSFVDHLFFISIRHGYGFSSSLSGADASGTPPLIRGSESRSGHCYR